MIFNIIFRASIRNSVPNFCLCVGGNVPCSLHDPSISCQEKTDFKAKRCPSILSVIHPLSNASSALLVLSSASLFQRLFIRPPCLLLRLMLLSLSCPATHEDSGWYSHPTTQRRAWASVGLWLDLDLWSGTRVEGKDYRSFRCCGCYS